MYNAVSVLLRAEYDRKVQVLNDEEEAEAASISKVIKNEADKLEALSRLHDLYNNRRLLSEKAFQEQLAELEKSTAIPVTPGDDKKGTGFFGCTCRRFGRWGSGRQHNEGRINYVWRYCCWGI
jgi:regulator of protease activity HflC (stomatin/prohibitin superfamily)